VYSVETVIEYYLRWMERFPDVRTLAAASDDDINSLWAGTYRRHEACQTLMLQITWL
jgi:adenine-specific DNA glycosylase